jgi:uncharacterized protein
MRYQNYSRSYGLNYTNNIGGNHMGAPVVHFEIMGGKGNQLEKFYGELFGWKIDSNNPMKYGVVDTGGGPGGINGGVGTSQDGNKRVSVYAS